jgi:hypothetical protein
MSKKNKYLSITHGDLFGSRILIHVPPKSPNPVLAVVKSWLPSSRTFGIVLDTRPDHVFYEALLRPGRTDWKLTNWEGDIWQTSDLRPLCPKCGHPLGVGSEAWTVCKPCGHPEPGVSSIGLLSRLRTNDPFRRVRVNYNDEDDED